MSAAWNLRNLPTYLERTIHCARRVQQFNPALYLPTPQCRNYQQAYHTTTLFLSLPASSLTSLALASAFSPSTLSTSAGTYHTPF